MIIGFSLFVIACYLSYLIYMKKYFIEENDISMYTNKKIDKIYSWFVILFMPLSTYATFIDGITVGDLSLIVLICIVFIYFIKTNVDLRKVVSTHLLIYAIFILIYSMILFLLKENAVFGLMSLLRYLLYILIATFGAKYFLKGSYTTKLYISVTLIVSIYLLMQYVSYYSLNIILPRTFFNLPSVVNSIPLEEYASKSYLIYRPSSVFIEPAHFAAFTIPSLYLLINYDDNFLKCHKLCSAIITLSLVISGSSTAIILVIICWIKPSIKILRKMNVLSIGFTSLITLSFLWISSLDYFSLIKNRIFNTSDMSLGKSFAGRFSNFNLLYNSLTVEDRVFGLGFGYEFSYLPSYGTLILYLGYIGVAFFLIIMMYLIIKSNKQNRGIIFIYLILFIGTNGLFGLTSILFFSISLINNGIGDRNSIRGDKYYAK